MTHRTIRAGAALIVALAAWGCNEQQLAPGISRDLSPPTVQISRSGGDTVNITQGLVFDIVANDNLALSTVSVIVTGGFVRTIDTSFVGTVTTTATLSTNEQFGENTTVGGFVYIEASATDGAGNASGIVRDSLFLFNENALIVTIERPAVGATTARGKTLPVKVRGTQRDGVAWVGYTTTGVLSLGDSLRVIGDLPTDTVFEGIMQIPDTAQLGIFTLRGFGVDGFGRRVESAPRNIEILSALNDTTPPTVTFTVNERVEVDDSITVHATDPSGITEMGWVATTLDGVTVVGQNSQTFGGDSTDVEFTWSLNLDPSAVGTSIQIDAYAIDAAGNDSRNAPASSSPAGAAAATQQAQLDTVAVVFGVTRALPAGGRVADAIYNANLNEVYLTNIERNRVEIFQLADTAFVPGGIPVGSHPWGIALWPLTTGGTYADTVVVANSGGANLSIVDVALRQERRRHLLPNFLIQTVKTEIDSDNGSLRLQIVEYDLSDRPQYVGTTCRTAACPEVYAVYSTTPTPTQPAPFANRGSIRWERIDAGGTESHFFWEHAGADISDATDTLQIIADRGGLTRDTVLSAACGRIVRLGELGFSDTTFVRNSGDFTNALVGEGGASPGPVGASARAIGYDAEIGVVTSGCSATVQGVTFTGREDVDFGVSPAIRVRDFIVNTATPVLSISLNFNGLTNLIRADSVWVLNGELKLVGSIPLGGSTPGMDLNFDHSFDAGQGGTSGTDGGTGDPNDRLLFGAGPNATVEIYDSWFYGRIASIPIRDPIIGPLRVAKTGTGDQILIGVTSAGVMLARIPAIANTFPSPMWTGRQE